MAERGLTIGQRFAELEERYSRVKSAGAGVRRAAEQSAERVQGMAVASGVAFGFGAWKARKSREAVVEDRALPTVAGIRPSLLYGAITYLVAPLVGGRNAEVLSAGALGLLAVAAYEIGLETSTT